MTHPAAHRTPILILILLSALLLAACGGGESGGTPITADELTARALAAAPTATRTPVPTLAPTDTPSHTPTPTDTPTPTPSPTLTPTNTPFRTNTPIPSPTQPGVINPNGGGNGEDGEPTWTPPPLDQALTVSDHYWMARPIPYGYTTWPARNYAYGATNGGRLQIHHGVDLVNTTGTPVLAVQDGTVFYAGDDLSGMIFGPQPNFYGNVIVIQHDFVTPVTGEPVFSLYGHLSAVEVEAGQRVTQGDQIGLVGAAGVALGPHLHFEVRLGDPMAYANTRNPELWIRPYRGYGTLAGRITDSAGNPLREAPLNVISATDPDFRRTAFTYAGDSVNADNVFAENYTLGDLPEGYYNVAVVANGSTLFRDQIYIYPNRTTWLEIALP